MSIQFYKMEWTIFYLLFITCAFIYEFLAEASIKKKQRAPGRIMAKWSYSLMAGSYILILFGAPIEYFMVKKNPNLIITAIGLIMYISGLLLRRWAVKTLNEFWSLHIEIKQNHKLIKDGPYKYVRHPNYLASLFKGFGFALIPNSYYMVVYIIAVFVPIRLIRIWIEEKELIKEFGQEYLDYKKEVPLFIP
ncbi:MAG: isoprenylcysteine carboxylmethyltransferase family protein [bacterium]